jgi:hypothetical protein
VLFDAAYLALLGVGDATLGEWKEIGDLAVHLRRRLKPSEMRYARIDAVVDVRGTEEYTRRIQQLRPFLPPQLAGLAELP